MTVDREQYKALHEYHKIQYDNEVMRGQKLEDKSAKYLTALTIAITAFILVVSKWMEKLELPLSHSFDIFVLLSIFFTFLCFCSAWSLVFRSLAMLRVGKLPSNQFTIDTFVDNQLESVYKSLSKRYVTAYAISFSNNQQKSDLMLKAYTDIAFSGWSFVISILLIFISKWLSNE